MFLCISLFSSFLYILPAYSIRLPVNPSFRQVQQSTMLVYWMLCINPTWISKSQRTRYQERSVNRISSLKNRDRQPAIHSCVACCYSKEIFPRLFRRQPIRMQRYLWREKGAKQVWFWLAFQTWFPDQFCFKTLTLHMYQELKGLSTSLQVNFSNAFLRLFCSFQRQFGVLDSFVLYFKPRDSLVGGRNHLGNIRAMKITTFLAGNFFNLKRTFYPMKFCIL